jgi:putative peptidoglycan lipid II flippase
VWLLFEGDSAISLLFERGQFSRSDAALTASLMVLLSPYILFSRAISIMQVPFYAVKDTKALVLGALLSFALYILITPLLLHALGVYGFPLATVGYTAAGTFIMCVLLRRSFGSLEWTRLRTFSLKLFAAIVLACVGLLLGRESWTLFTASTLPWTVLAIGVQTLLGLIGFLAGTMLFHLIEPAQFLRSLPFGFGNDDVPASPVPKGQ